MRTLGLLGAIGLVVGLGVPAFAADQGTADLFAVSQVTAVQSMTDQQLTAVEGMSYRAYHGGYYHGKHSYGPIDQSNGLGQLNVNNSCKCGKWGHGGQVSQQNMAEQLNNVYGRHGRIDQTNFAEQANMNFGGGHFVQQANGAYQANNIR